MSHQPSSPRAFILPFIVVAQFCCTSLWFAGNAVVGGLATAFDLPAGALASLTSSVQFGFITGTLLFALLTLTDRFSPSKVFLICALLGAAANALIVVEGNTLFSLLGLRFLTGCCLAGVYPVGMKIAADHFDRGLGTSLGYLVGALVLGTAFPHLLRSLGQDLPWRTVLLVTSGLAVFGGLLIGFFVPDGPHRKAGKGVRLTAFLRVFQKADFRRAAFGYFGHMWELYAFWVFVPVLLLGYATASGISVNVSGWAFAIIAVGGLTCVLGGYLARRFSERRVAYWALATSGVCCLLSPFALGFSPVIFFGFLLVWGAAVVADSPLFSTQVARTAPAESKGTALTIVNCVGFAITIVSIQLLGYLIAVYGVEWAFLVLGVGPAAGLLYGAAAGAKEG